MSARGFKSYFALLSRVFKMKP